MLRIVRSVVLVIELVGLFFVLKLAHEGNFGGALYRLGFDVLVILVFVLTHILVELVLRRFDTPKRGAWQGREWWL